MGTGREIYFHTIWVREKEYPPNLWDFMNGNTRQYCPRKYQKLQNFIKKKKMFAKTLWLDAPSKLDKI